MGNTTGASQFASLLDKAVLWFTGLHSAGVSGDINEFPIIPSGVTVTNNGTFTKTALGNNRSVLNFDGSTNYISLSDNAAWQLYSADFTISTWINCNQLSANEVIFLQFNGSKWIEYYIRSDNKYPCIGGYDGSKSFAYQGDYTVLVDTWYHITVLRSGGSWYWYINGTLVNTIVNVAYTSFTYFTSPVYVGYDTSIFFSGNIKDLMIYTRALTQPEIKLLMNRTHPITGKGMMVAPYSYWRLS